MRNVWASLFLLMLWLLPVNIARSESMAAPIKKSSSLLTKAARPAINVICRITDDLRWILLIFALGEFVVERGHYDMFNSTWLRLWVGAMVVHAVCENI